MKVLGISPLDKDATVSLVEDGAVLFAAGEERFSRQKQHAGFPYGALEKALAATGTRIDEIDQVVYAFLEPEKEEQLIRRSTERSLERPERRAWTGPLRRARAKGASKHGTVPGLESGSHVRRRDLLRRTAYWALGAAPVISTVTNRRLAKRWIEESVAGHRHWKDELTKGLAHFGIAAPLKHYEHHLTHAANAYHASGLDRALIVTLDGYGSGLTGSVSLGEGGKITRLQNLLHPHSLGTFYQYVTAALGYVPDRHAGKIVGLAAYGDTAVLEEVLRARFLEQDGDYEMEQAFNHYFDFYLGTQFAMVDMAAAYQRVLELVATRVVRHFVAQTGIDAVVLSGGVTANVKMNQRIYEVEGVERVFVYPNMGDGGCGTGAAMHASKGDGLLAPLEHVYHGPSFGEAEIEQALRTAGLDFTRSTDHAAEVARRIHAGQVVARFDGAMEYGPRALGNRSILYHAREPDVNQWLNRRLGRTEFMPFAPVTLWEERERSYINVAGAEHAAQFMAITFDCTPWMRDNCPAAVHVDGTARPQLIRREINPGYYDIVAEYQKLSGIPTIVNTSFNMHEEPIVCTPDDAIRAFLQGNLDVLAAGPFLVEHPERVTGDAEQNRRAEEMQPA